MVEFTIDNQGTKISVTKANVLYIKQMGSETDIFLANGDVRVKADYATVKAALV
jgi:hypothetical protein